ncbi:MAG: DUF1593 domain-containing protein [Saprospiraceae bacterium]|nr:DUF1593 domain-containing protein [Saprospiraceae bacterium]
MIPRSTYFNLGFLVCLFSSICCQNVPEGEEKLRVIISTDIGGTDPDDFQSMIHLLMYSDRLQIEGLISSPYGPGRKKDILDMIDLYGQDLPKLKRHSAEFPSVEDLKFACKQGAIQAAPYRGYSQSSEGSEWIVECAQRTGDQPLWILVWGGLEDLAQALHDAPEIESKIKVYWIGGPNKKWSVNAYSYIATQHPDLWFIEANATYRGWFLDEYARSDLTNRAFYRTYIQGHGAMGVAFKDYYNGEIKMGDTPSLMYLLNGNPDDPTGPSWGGSFEKLRHSPYHLFTDQSSVEDTVAAYATLEWRFKGPNQKIPVDSVCFELEIWNQKWPGYAIGNGTYVVRYSSKRPESEQYHVSSKIKELEGLSGFYRSTIPWPSEQDEDDWVLGDHWYTDVREPDMFIGFQQGAKTVARYREAFLLDWAKRWTWLAEH